MSIRVYLLRLPIAVACVAVAAILASCGSPPIALNGVVTDAYTGKPVSAARLTLGASEIATDAAGKYQFTQWSDKDTLKIVANGYEPISVALESRPELAQPTPPSATLDARLRPNTLSGVVVDSYTGKPV